MSSAVAELEAGLQAMLALKPPGVSGSRIQNLTSLCLANIQSESVLIQKLFTHFKKAPGTHKLGVLYVVDSVTRKWTEQAKANGQVINSSAQDGTFAAGVHRVTELLPVLMNDIVQSAPEDQKDKIKKLVDIWEKGQTFPVGMLNSFKEKLNAPPPKSTTPEGTPPPRDIQMSSGAQQSNPSGAAVSNTSSILEALANMARQNTTAPAVTPSVPAQSSSYVPNAHNNPAQQMAPMNPQFAFTPSTQSVNVPAPAASFAPQAPGPSNAVQNYPSNPAMSYGALPQPLSQGTVNPNLQAQIAILQTLAAQGIPQEQMSAVLAALYPQGNANNAGAAAGLVPPVSQLPGTNLNQTSWSATPQESRDRNGYLEPVRSPPGRYRRRSRSPSPARGWGGRDSPSSRRRDETGYGDYGRDSPGRGRGDDRGRGRGAEYRQRSPPRRGRSATPPGRNHDSSKMGRGEKWVDFDSSIGKGNIKVLSRTLFVGGVTCTEHDLRNIFDRFGKVQTCIVNKEKRHAFVKMISRKDAVNAKDSMESSRSPDSQLRTRWGVGFGPRDCSDYQTGVSIIPINKLTDADRKWMLTAEFGGSGGKPIESGMVVEEPDIEIGQGVSSKAISRRMQTDKGGSNGPKSSRDREDDDSRYRRDRSDGRRDDEPSDRASSYATQPNMPLTFPGFPYPMPTLPNSMAMFAAGFPFTGQNQGNQQPPPPGHRT